jgi:Lipid A 3-O-deacylase (PagL)
MKRLANSLLLLLLYLPGATAQAAPAQGDQELRLWTGGGPGVSGGVGGIGAWNLGLRYGWVLTDLHGPAIVRGRFEYAWDVVPVFCVFEPKRTAHGFAVDPFALKWDFQQRRLFIPYFEISGGALFTSRDVPPEISRVSFASGAAVGPYFPAGKFHWSAELRYMHISDAGLTNPNPGINTIQVGLSLGVFRHRKERQL